LARQKQVLLNFIDFKKAFNCIHKESLWKISANYGNPNKLINIKKCFYQGSCCVLRAEYCYLGRTINQDRGCEREVMIWLGKANSVFGRLGDMGMQDDISGVENENV